MYRAVMAAICHRQHNLCVNCQSRVKWTTDFWQFTSVAKGPQSTKGAEKN
jgi:hypothetical protein